MESLIRELQNAMMERYKQSILVKGMEKKVSKSLESLIMEKHKGTKILREGLTYELYGVDAAIDSWDGEYSISKVNTFLFYIIVSDLTKEEKIMVTKLKRAWDNEKNVWYDRSKYKKEFFIRDEYDIGVDLIIRKQINLGIKDKQETN